MKSKLSDFYPGKQEHSDVLNIIQFNNKADLNKVWFFMNQYTQADNIYQLKKEHENDYEFINVVNQHKLIINKTKFRCNYFHVNEKNITYKPNENKYYQLVGQTSQNNSCVDFEYAIAPNSLYQFNLQNIKTIKDNMLLNIINDKTLQFNQSYLNELFSNWGCLSNAYGTQIIDNSIYFYTVEDGPLTIIENFAHKFSDIDFTWNITNRPNSDNLKLDIEHGRLVSIAKIVSAEDADPDHYQPDAFFILDEFINNERW